MTRDEKVAYAKLLVNEPNPFEAAKKLYPNDIGKALFVARVWADLDQPGKYGDEELQNIVSSFRNGSGGNTLSQDEVYLETKLKTVIETAPQHRDRIEAMKLYAEIKGIRRREPAVSNNVTVFAPKVIEKPTFGSNSEWELAAEKQQSELLNVSRSRH